MWRFGLGWVASTVSLIVEVSVLLALASFPNLVEVCFVVLVKIRKFGLLSIDPFLSTLIPDSVHGNKYSSIYTIHPFGKVELERRPSQI